MSFVAPAQQQCLHIAYFIQQRTLTTGIRSIGGVRKTKLEMWEILLKFLVVVKALKRCIRLKWNGGIYFLFQKMQVLKSQSRLSDLQKIYQKYN